MKLCKSCKQSHPLSDFADDPKSPDGKRKTCILARARTKLWIQQNKKHIQEYEAGYRAKKLQEDPAGWEDSPIIQARFFAKIAYCEHGPICIYCCHWWTGTTTGSDGAYGQFNPTPRRHVLAHRAAWTLHHKKSIPPDMEICHECDEGLCVNGTHLFPGTSQDNTNDMRKKNRQNWLKPGDPITRLLPCDVTTIRILAKQGFSYSILHGIFGITPVAISSMILYKTWKHVRLSSYA